MVLGPLKDLPDQPRRDFYEIILWLWGFFSGIFEVAAEEALPALELEHRSGACLDSPVTDPAVRAEQAALQGLL